LGGFRGKKRGGRKEKYGTESLNIILYHIHEDYQKVKTELAMVFD
jgi:hypothetical protein